jgi:tetratricopeptide (TPR) repeat protein/DNA-binding winged helix-turn-helix (wHTH) protein
VSSFVGRDGERARVRELIARETVFLIYGIAGLGKSELAFKIFEDLAADPDWLPLGRLHVEVPQGRCVGDLIALIRSQLTGRSPARDVQVPAAAGEELAGLTAVLAARPHLLFIDDAHHLPRDELAALVEHICRHGTGSRLFIASRTEVPLRPSGATPVEIRLGPLSDGEAAEVVSQLSARLGIEPGEDRTADIIRRAKGSPFYLRRYLVESSRPSAGGGDSLEESLAALEPPARRLLLMAAALRAVDVARLPSQELLVELTRRFLVEIKRGRAVVHDLIAESLSRSASAGELREARIAAAELLIGDGVAAAPLDAVRAIDCLCEAGAWDRAWEIIGERFGSIAAAGIDYLLLDGLRAIAERAADLGAEPALLRGRILVRSWRIEEAVALASDLARDPAALESFELWYFLGEIAQRTGDLALSLERFERALELARGPRDRQKADLQIAWVAALYGEGDHARELISGAGADPSRSAWLIAGSYLLEGRYARAAAVARAARLALEGEGREDLHIRLGMLEILGLVESDQVLAARAVVEEVIEPGARLGLIREYTAALYRGAVLYARGRITEAIEDLGAAYESTAGQRDALNACIAGYFFAAALIAAGRAGEACDVASRTDEVARLAHLDSLRAHGLVRRAQSRLAAGQLELAGECAREALELPRATYWVRALAQAIRAQVAALAGRFDVAARALAAAREAATESEQRHPLARVELAAAQVALLAGQLDQAVAAAERARAHLGPAGRVRAEAMALGLEALARVSRGGQGDRVIASECIRRALELAESGGFRDAGTMAIVAEAVLDRAAGDRDRAHERLTAALRELALDGGLARQLLVLALQGGGDGDGEAGDPATPPGLATLVANLGLAGVSRYRLIDRHGRRPISDEVLEREKQTRDLWVDAEGAVLIAGGKEAIRGRPITCRLVAALIEAEGETVAPERLYCEVWEAREYHPLRHRNTLYVAINRLRRTLRQLLPGREVVETGSGGWRLAADVDACSVRRLEG